MGTAPTSKSDRIPGSESICCSVSFLLPAAIPDFIRDHPSRKMLVEAEVGVDGVVDFFCAALVFGFTWSAIRDDRDDQFPFRICKGDGRLRTAVTEGWFRSCLTETIGNGLSAVAI